MEVRMRNDTIVCSRCGGTISIYRYKVHQKSPTCKHYAAVSAALDTLRGVGYDALFDEPTVRLSTYGKRSVRVLAAGLDRGFGDDGNLTVVFADGKIQQYLDGEWVFTSIDPRTEKFTTGRFAGQKASHP
jgi:hypothetical protein